MVYYVVTCKILYVHIVITIQTHKYAHIAHNMSTHKFECPVEILTIDEGIYRKAAHIYVKG